MKVPSVKKYYDILYKEVSLFFKRVFDIVMALIVLIVSLPVFIFIGIAIKLDSRGPVLFRQVRVTQYGREFKIFKVPCTMVINADKLGTQVTTKNDNRITGVE